MFSHSDGSGLSRSSNDASKLRLRGTTILVTSLLLSTANVTAHSLKIRGESDAPAKSYCLSPYRMSRSDCSTYCAWKGATPACIENDADNQAALHVLDRDLDTTRNHTDLIGAWIGLQLFLGFSVWPTGCASTYTNWQPGEPNGGFSQPYVEMYSSNTPGKGAGKWNDDSNRLSLQCLCSQPATTANSSTTMSPTTAPQPAPTPNLMTTSPTTTQITSASTTTEYSISSSAPSLAPSISSRSTVIRSTAAPTFMMSAATTVPPTSTTTRAPAVVTQPHFLRPLQSLMQLGTTVEIEMNDFRSPDDPEDYVYSLKAKGSINGFRNCSTSAQCWDARVCNSKETSALPWLSAVGVVRRNVTTTYDWNLGVADLACSYPVDGNTAVGRYLDAGAPTASSRIGDVHWSDTDVTVQIIATVFNASTWRRTCFDLDGDGCDVNDPWTAVSTQFRIQPLTMTSTTHLSSIANGTDDPNVTTMENTEETNDSEGSAYSTMNSTSHLVIFPAVMSAVAIVIAVVIIIVRRRNNCATEKTSPPDIMMKPPEFLVVPHISACDSRRPSEHIYAQITGDRQIASYEIPSGLLDPINNPVFENDNGISETQSDQKSVCAASPKDLFYSPTSGTGLPSIDQSHHQSPSPVDAPYLNALEPELMHDESYDRFIDPHAGYDSMIDHLQGRPLSHIARQTYSEGYAYARPALSTAADKDHVYEYDSSSHYESGSSSSALQDCDLVNGGHSASIDEYTLPTLTTPKQ